VRVKVGEIKKDRTRMCEEGRCVCVRERETERDRERTAMVK